jgi:hypothetical protein
MKISPIRPAALVRLFPLALPLMLTGCGTSSGGGNASTPTTGSGGTTTSLSVSSVSPKDIPVGSADVTVVVTGTGFTSSTKIILDGTTEPTTFVSATELRATVSAAQLQTGKIFKLSLQDGVRSLAADAGVQVSNPTPTLNTIAPAFILVGSPATTVSVTGTNFVSGVVLGVNGSPRNTTYVSATELSAALTTDDFSTANPVLLNVINPQPGGGASGTSALRVQNPAPAISSISPSSVEAGSTSSLTVTVSGTGFVPGTGILVNGATRTATYASNTNMRVALTTADLANAGTLAITALNVLPGGGISGSASFSVTNPTPSAITLSPAASLAGSGATQVSVSGSKFLPSTVIQVNGSARSTTFVSSSQVLASLTAIDQANAGSLTIVATNPGPGGGSSPAAAFAVNNPAPGSVSVAPNLVATGTTTATPITLTGANFVPATVVRVNGSVRDTIFVSSTQLQSALTAADQSANGSLSITAFTPTPGGGSSSAASIAVNGAVLGSISLSPSTVVAGTTRDTVVTVAGTGFVSGTSVRVNGSARSTTFLNTSTLTFILTVADAASAGRLNITAVNPAPDSTTSSAAVLTVAAPTATPVINAVNPTTFTIGAASNMSVSGTGFTTSSVVQWNGTNLSTSYTTGTIYNGVTYTTTPYLLAAVPASLLTSAGTAAVTVYSSTAASSTSNTVNVTVQNPPMPAITALSPASGPINTAVRILISGSGFNTASTVSVNGSALTTTYNSSASLSVDLPASIVARPGNVRFSVTTPAPGGGTSPEAVFTAYVPLTNNSMVYNPVNGLLYLTVPSSVGAPFGNSVVSMDPATGALGTPILVGSEPNKIAVTADGKYLWVGLDGSSAVRKVDLTTGTAGLQFSITGGNAGVYNPPSTVLALAALPGATDSVVIASSQSISSSGLYISIYDNGVLRGGATGSYPSYNFYALQVDGSRNEIYAGGSTFATYLYNATGVTLKTSNTNSSPAPYYLDEMQLLNGRLYTGTGKVLDAESGALLGSFYNTGTALAQGPTVADGTLGKAFVLDLAGNSYSYSSSYNQIQVFNTSDFTAAGPAIPISVTVPSTNASGVVPASRLIRWGANGLALRTTSGVYSLQSNLVKDLSTTAANLSVALSASGGAATGSNGTFIATIRNDGPSTATDVVLQTAAPTNGIITNAVASSGTCTTAGALTCSIGSLANGASKTVTYTVLQTSAGTSTLGVRVSASTTDTDSTNDSANASLTVTGAEFSLTPSITALSPSSVIAGASDTILTITGKGFNSGSQILLGGAPLPTTFANATTLTATIPGTNLATIGWAPIAVANASPGGGTSAVMPLTVYSVLTVGLNHMLYDPYTRKIMASVGSGSSTLNGNSIVALTPETGTFGTPVTVGSQPTKIALSRSGKTLYSILAGANGIARYDMATGTSATAQLSPTYNSSSTAAADIAVQPGSENTLGIEVYYFSGTGIFDWNTSNSTLVQRGTNLTGAYTGSCLQFLDANNLFAFDVDTTGAQLYHYPVTATGIGSPGAPGVKGSTLRNFGCFKIDAGFAFAINGGIANPATDPATQIATLGGITGSSFSSSQAVAPDVSLRRSFLPTATTTSSLDGLAAYDLSSFLRAGTLPLGMAAIEGSTSYSFVDLIRWGQDGLAALTSTGHVYLLRGPFVVPQLLNTNTAAVLASSSAATITQGAGNTLLTLTGSNFIPGVAVTWNGSYRTTTIVDATHVTVALPGADLAATGTGSLVATNPGAPASSAITVTIQ